MMKPFIMNSVLLNNCRSFAMGKVHYANLFTIESPAYAESIKEGDIQFVKKVWSTILHACMQTSNL